MASYFDNTANPRTDVQASTTPETYLGENLRGANPRLAHGLPKELFVITKTSGRAPGDVGYWGRGLTEAEAQACNQRAAIASLHRWEASRAIEGASV